MLKRTSEESGLSPSNQLVLLPKQPFRQLTSHIEPQVEYDMLYEIDSPVPPQHKSQVIFMSAEEMHNQLQLCVREGFNWMHHEFPSPFLTQSAWMDVDGQLWEQTYAPKMTKADEKSFQKIVRRLQGNIETPYQGGNYEDDDDEEEVGRIGAGKEVSRHDGYEKDVSTIKRRRKK